MPNKYLSKDYIASWINSVECKGLIQAERWFSDLPRNTYSTKNLERTNTYPTQTFPENWRGRQTAKWILRGHHHP